MNELWDTKLLSKQCCTKEVSEHLVVFSELEALLLCKQSVTFTEFWQRFAFFAVVRLKQETTFSPPMILEESLPVFTLALSVMLRMCSELTVL